jgi:hypothetical protein
MKKKNEKTKIMKFGVTPDSLTLCPHCFCMTHTMKGNICGKCKKKK